jgi:hypothetical protein
MEIDRSRFRKKVTGPVTGQEFEIRKVSIGDFMRDIGDLPVAASTTLTEQMALLETKLAKKLDADPNAEKDLTKFFLERGVVAPRVYFGEENQCPEDQICLADLAGDSTFLVGQIAEFSFELRGLQELANFFRGAGAANLGPSSQEIQGATPQALANGNGAAES